MRTGAHVCTAYGFLLHLQNISCVTFPSLEAKLETTFMYVATYCTNNIIHVRVHVHMNVWPHVQYVLSTSMYVVHVCHVCVLVHTC